MVKYSFRLGEVVENEMDRVVFLRFGEGDRTNLMVWNRLRVWVFV